MGQFMLYLSFLPLNCKLHTKLLLCALLYPCPLELRRYSLASWPLNMCTARILCNRGLRKGSEQRAEVERETGW